MTDPVEQTPHGSRRLLAMSDRLLEVRRLMPR
jgi:hypothetical protein